MRIDSIIGYPRPRGVTLDGQRAWGEVRFSGEDRRLLPLKLNADQMNRILVICAEVFNG